MIDQIVIALCGPTAIWLSQDTRVSRQRWSCVVGLVAQPAWFYAAWSAQQWGIFLVALMYTVSWARGIYNFWWKPRTVH